MASPSELRTRGRLRRERRELRESGGPTTGKGAWVKPAITSSFVTLLVAAIGGVITVSATQYGAHETRAKESREIRARIYADFLEAADRREATAVDLESRRAAYAYASYCWRRRLGKGPAPVEPSPAQYVAATVQYKKQLNLIYVYGSDDAWAAAQTMYRDQPEPAESAPLVQHYEAVAPRASCGDETTPIRDLGLGEDAPTRKVDAFRTAYEAFRRIFCAEASALPRRGCTATTVIPLR